MGRKCFSVMNLRSDILMISGELIYPAQVELVVRRESLVPNKIFTVLIIGLVGIAMVFLGLDLDIQIIIATIKVKYQTIRMEEGNEEGDQKFSFSFSPSGVRALPLGVAAD